MKCCVKGCTNDQRLGFYINNAPGEAAWMCVPCWEMITTVGPSTNFVSGLQSRVDELLTKNNEYRDRAMKAEAEVLAARTTLRVVEQQRDGVLNVSGET